MKKLLLKISLVIGLSANLFADAFGVDIIGVWFNTYSIDYKKVVGKNSAIQLNLFNVNKPFGVDFVGVGGRVGYQYYFMKQALSENYIGIDVNYHQVDVTSNSETVQTKHLGPILTLGYMTGDGKGGLYWDYALTYGYLFSTGYNTTTTETSYSSGGIWGFKVMLGFLF